jgi:hypothetical protein
MSNFSSKFNYLVPTPGEPRGRAHEVDMWPNQVGDICHILIAFISYKGS